MRPQQNKDMDSILLSTLSSIDKALIEKQAKKSYKNFSGKISKLLTSSVENNLKKGM